MTGFHSDPTQPAGLTPAAHSAALNSAGLAARAREELQRQETLEYLGLNALATADREMLMSRITTPCIESVRTISDRALQTFHWNGNALGEFIPDKREALKKGARYESYARIEPLAFSSATVGIPDRVAATAAYVAAEHMANLVASGDRAALETFMAQVSARAFEELCRHYDLDAKVTSALFDDNATMATYQLLPLLNLKPKDHILTFFDTGRVMPQALLGRNPEFLPFNFKPAVDVWGNHEAVRPYSRDIGPFSLHLVEHYIEKYRSNDEILEEVLALVDSNRPALFIIPTVTRLGRRIAFIEMCEAIRLRAAERGYQPTILLDDCQGLSRLESYRYRTRMNGSSVSSMWDYIDGVILTGAKVTGALMGSGAVLMRRSLIEERLDALASSPLMYRSRQYALIGLDRQALVDFNLQSPRYAQTPELASLTVALQEIPPDDQVFRIMRLLREGIIEHCRRIPRLQVLEPEGAMAIRFVDSIISFYLKDDPHGGGRLKEILAQPRSGDNKFDTLPITIPAIVSADRREYLRIALDPKRVMRDAHYLAKLDYVLASIHRILEADWPPGG